MGKQIGILYTQTDELELVEAISRKFDVWSLPRFFGEGEGIPKRLGAYRGIDQKIFLGTMASSVHDYFVQVNETNWTTMESTLTSAYHLHSRLNFYIEWNTCEIKNKQPEAGRFYLRSQNGYTDAPSEEVKQLFAFISRSIKRNSSHITKIKSPRYIGKDMAKNILSGELSYYENAISNPGFKVE